MRKLIFVSFVACVALLYVSCSQIMSINEYAKQGIGRSVNEVKKIINNPRSYASSIGWKEKTYPLDNGNWVYIEPDSKNCFIHWEVNAKGTIVGYKLEGSCNKKD